MNGFILPILTVAVGVLLALGPVLAWTGSEGSGTAIGSKIGGWGTLVCCGIGACATLLHLATGAVPVFLAVPLGLASQSTILVLDSVSDLFLLVVLLTGAAAAAASLDDHGHPPATAPAFPVFVAGMVLTLVAGDAFAAVAGFELMSLASFILVLTNHRDVGVRAAGLLYFGMASISAICLIAAFALLAVEGASFAAIRAHPPEAWRAVAVLVLVLVGTGSKAGLAPLHIWLPPAHSAAPGHVSALMSGAMTKVAIYLLVRILFDLCGPAQPIWWFLPLLAMGVASALLGALRANLETDIKAVLACSTIENIGLVTIGLAVAMAARAADLSALAGLALGAALLHVLVHGLFKSLLFLGAGAVQHGAGSRQLTRLGGVIQRMPITGCGMLLGAFCLAGLPPSAGFASEWALFQAVFGAVRIGGLGLQILICVLAAILALVTALAASAAIRLVGVALLGRPRTPRAAAAEEAGPPTRWAILFLGTLVVLTGLFPGLALHLAEPALHLLANTTMADRAGAFGIVPTAELPGYAPLAVALLLGVAAIVIAVVLRARAVMGHRTGPAWDCGFGAPPAWLPFGDPLTQYGGGSFAQPLRRILGGVLLGARAQVDMPEPGDTRPAVFTEQAQDPVEAYLFAPIGRLRGHLSALTDRMHFLTVRQTLTVIVTVLIAFLGIVALVEQL